MKALSYFGKIFVLFGIVFSFSACKNNGNNALGNIDAGRFSAEVSGAVNRSFEGIALFTVQQLGPPTGNIFVLSMNSLNTEPVYAISVSFSNSGRPGENTFTFDSESTDRFVDFIVFESSQNLLIFGAQSGEITFNSSSEQRLQGEISFQATNTSTDEEIQVTALFNANCQQGQVLSCN